MTKREQFKQQLADLSNICIAPGAYDALSAKLIELAGFSAVYMTGYGVSASKLGLPDIGLTSMTEMVEAARNMVNAVDIPVIADADTGFGTVLGAVRTAGEYERAGVAALQLEDQVYPKRCGHMEGKEVISEKEMAEKIRAIAENRENKNFLIIARTDARAVYGLDAAIERCKLYREAGADIIFLEAPQSAEEMRKAVQSIDAPMLANMVNNSKSPFFNGKQLQEIGYRLAIYPVVSLYTMTKACLDNLARLKDGEDMKQVENNMVDFPAFNQYIRLKEAREFEQKYTPRD